MTRPRCKVDLTKPHITDYTETEFAKVVDGLYEQWHDEEWTAEAEVMFERVVAHPDGVGLVYNAHYAPHAIRDLREWYQEQGLPFLQPDPIRPITDYTEAEFMSLLVEINKHDKSEEDEDDLINLFDDAVEHPEGSQLIFWPEGHDGSPESVMKIIKQWYEDNKKPCFKNG